MLTLRHYLIFQTAAETGSFTAAAKKLYMTQSAVSHAVHEMEAYTGVPLFDRLSRQVRLTPAGSLLLEEVAPILSSCRALEKRIHSLQFQAPIQLVSSITIASFWLPEVLKAFRGLHPEIPVHVQVVPAAEALRTLRSGGADAALVEGARPQGPFCCTCFSKYRLLFLCAPDYPLPSQELTPEELCAERLLLREPGSAIRDTFDSRLFLLGHTASPLWTSVNSTALIQAARAGLGITVLPDVLAAKELRLGGLIALHVKDLELENELLAVRRRDRRISAALEELLQLLQPQTLDVLDPA